MPAVRSAVAEQNKNATAQGRPTIDAETIDRIAEELLGKTSLALWKDKAAGAIGAGRELRLRDLRAVVSSMEKLRRRNAHLADPKDVPAQMKGVTIGHRVNEWLNNPPVGLALARLQDSMQQGNDRHFHFVIYEKLISNPDAEMELLYKYLDEDNFFHDFGNIEQKVDENDSLHGAYGDHKVRPRLSALPDDWDTILSRPIADAIVKSNRWYYDQFYPHIK